MTPNPQIAYANHTHTGSEAFLLRTLRAGGQGCISATANVNPRAIHEVNIVCLITDSINLLDRIHLTQSNMQQLYRKHEMPEAEVLQERCNAVRDRFASTGQILPSMKAAVAHFSGDKEWERVRPPLVELEAEKKRQLLDGLVNMGFKMPGLRGAAGDR